MKKQERELRQAMVGQCRWMNAVGLNQGTSGNVGAQRRPGADYAQRHPL